MSRILVSVEPNHAQTGCNRKERKHYTIASGAYTQEAASVVIKFRFRSGQSKLQTPQVGGGLTPSPPKAIYA